MTACVQNYKGHVNEITHGLPFYLDASDCVIFAGKLLGFLKRLQLLSWNALWLSC